jgi:hypothetical protein
MMWRSLRIFSPHITSNALEIELTAPLAKGQHLRLPPGQDLELWQQPRADRSRSEAGEPPAH